MNKLMKKTIFVKGNYVILALFILFMGGFFLKYNKVEALEVKGPRQEQLISHAGGAIYGYRYTNSLESLEESYKNGFKLIEFDFDWTSDNKVVAIHDWEGMFERLFMTEARTLSLEEFKSLDTLQDLTLMDLEDVAGWLRLKEDAYIVTDVKNRNIEFLQLVARDYSDVKNQMIPQIYSFAEYAKVKAMGYENIILTLYRTSYTDEEIMKFVAKNNVFAITMPIERGQTKLPMKLKEKGIFTYVHTVNSLDSFEALHKNGVRGIYTDYFHANRLSL